MADALNYLEVCKRTKTIYVHPEKRNWAQGNNDQHLEYHIQAVDAVGGCTFAVDVDAARVPYAALLHAPFFLRLARHARKEYKDRLREVIIRNASAPARYIVAALSAAGAIPAETAGKITFVEKNNGKDD